MLLMMMMRRCDNVNEDDNDYRNHYLSPPCRYLQLYAWDKPCFQGILLRTYIKKPFERTFFTVVVTCKLNVNIEKCGCEGVDGSVDQQIAFLLSYTYLLAYSMQQSPC